MRYSLVPPKAAACAGLWALAGIVQGCTPSVGLVDVPIVGGTSAQQGVARAVLADFDEWSGRDVDLSRLEFLTPAELEARRPVDYATLGQYETWSDAIFVRSDLTTVAIRNVVTHELCHAWDHDRKLSHALQVWLSDMADTASSATNHPHHRFTNPNSDAYRGDPNGELFAQVCELGPAATSLLARPCGDDAWPIGGLAYVLEQDVWASGTLDDAIATLTEPHKGPFATALAPDRFLALGALESDQLVVAQLEDKDSSHLETEVTVDLLTHRATDGTSNTSSLDRAPLDDVQLPYGLQAPLSPGLSVLGPTEVVEFAEGRVAIAHLDPRSVGRGTVPRLLVEEAGQWAIHPRCLLDGANVARVRSEQAWVVEPVLPDGLQWSQLER